MREKWKRNDIWLFLAIVLAALFLFLWQRAAFSVKGAVAVVSRDGETIGSYSLDGEERIVFTGSGGERNVLTIRDGEAYMEEADCPDRLCVKQGPVGKNGESIICLPHKLAVQIISEQTGEADILVK
ncbi:MAG: NusG domain II-containing protein [Lachnospiraceae bacterium]|jgi:hypothetical protein|nr:NusG domain II-containing protein [Lachnospiraceae bacterium]